MVSFRRISVRFITILTMLLTLGLIFVATITGHNRLSNAETTNNPNLQPKDQIILSDFNSKELPDRTVCGLAKKTSEGVVTEIDEFPWTAALEFRRKIPPFDNVGVLCAGSLINNRYVLTSANCVLKNDFEPVTVRLGEWNITSDPDCDKKLKDKLCADSVKKVAIQGINAHPFYSETNGNNDIALVRLDEDVHYTNYIRPICLPPLNLPNPEVGIGLKLVGWQIKDGKFSDVKLKVDRALLSDDECIKKLMLENDEPAFDHRCVEGNKEADFCVENSGGAVMRKYYDTLSSQSLWFLEGVVFSRDVCISEKTPVVYIRVSRYITWILNQIIEEDRK